jgi:tetratricopeptide (TPR) repeat protein
MSRKLYSPISVLFLAVFFAAFSHDSVAQIPNQLAQDFVAGRVPGPEEVAIFEKEAAAKPDDLRLTRKLGKAYFFQFFGGGDAGAVPRAQKTLEQALVLKKDDPETLAYLGALHIFTARRLHKQDPVKQKAGYDRGFELVKLAEKLDPRHGAVVSVAAASYIVLPDSYAMAPHVVEMLEGMRKAMGPVFKRFAHHGQQRLLLTLGQAYVKTGQPEKAKAAFDEALAVNGTSVEAGMLRSELAKLSAPPVK